MKNSKGSLIKFPILAISALAFLMPLSANADQNCDSPNNDFDGLYCLTKVYIEADKELNNSYGQLMKRLNKSQSSLLKRGQLAWIKQRDNNCSRYEDDSFYVNMACATRTTTERVNFLNDRLRECQAGSCRDSRLGE